MKPKQKSSGEMFTYHLEPISVGGSRYVRCEGCGTETLGSDPEHLIHKNGCRFAEYAGVEIKDL